MMTDRRILIGVLGLGVTLAWLLGLAAPFGTPALAQDDGPAPARQQAPKAPLGTAFTFQGQLRADGAPVDGSCDFHFSLYDAASDGTQVGQTLETSGVPVNDGLFSVVLDFGLTAFDGAARWLEIAVHCTDDTDYTTLGRQALTAAPQALYALGAPWSGISDVPAGFADGVDDVGESWSLTGNSGTISGTHFLGTTDDVALELRVNGTHALRLEPNAYSPNLIAGYSGNSVTDGAQGASIGGGGNSDHPNQVQESYATVGGGYGNTAGSRAATVGGGYGNTASSGGSTVSGGWINTASGNEATVGGGFNNRASGDSAAVPGGAFNNAAGDYSFAAGWRAKANHDGAFVWADTTQADFTSAAANTFSVRAENGAYIVSNNTTCGLEVMNLGDGDGIRALADVSTGYWLAALYANNNGTSPGVYANSGGTYSGYFRDSIHVDGSVDTTALVQLGVNQDSAPLETGDLVAVAGLGSPLAGTETPLLRVRRAASGDTAIGVVQARARVLSGTRDGERLESAQQAEGPAAAGEHLFIVVFGMAEVKIDASAGDIAVGQRLTVAEWPGQARALRTETLNGMLVIEGSPVIGVALAEPTTGADTIPVFVTLR
jgi:hypothetical protein